MWISDLRRKTTLLVAAPIVLGFLTSLPPLVLGQDALADQVQPPAQNPVPRALRTSEARARVIEILSLTALAVALTTMSLFFFWGRKRYQWVRKELEILDERISEQERAIQRVQAGYQTDISQVRGLLCDQALIIGDWHLARTESKESPESAGRSEALKQTYAEFRARLQRIASLISLLEPQVTAVQQAAFAPENLLTVVGGFTEEFRRMTNLESTLTESEARLLERLAPDKRQHRSLREAVLEGQIDPASYLQKILALEAPLYDETDLPNPEAEQERLRLEVDQFPARFLAWLDQAAEIREEAGETQTPLSNACTQLIAAARPIAQDHWQVEIEDVAVGRTRFDGRLHDLVVSKPSSGIAPETIIAVHGLGHRRDGKVIRKPQVVVAAAM